MFLTGGRLRVTVQVLEPPESSDVGLQAREETARGGATTNEACKELPFSVAVTSTDCTVETAPAEAVNDADDPLAGTITEAGTVRNVLLLESVTVAPEGTVWLNVTVQLEELPFGKDVGLQVRLERIGDVDTTIEPPVAVTEIGPPVAEAPSPLARPIARVPLAPADKVSVMTAATPVGITLVFIPDTKHVNEPGFPAQSIDLPAAMAAEPAVAEMATIPEGG
jgi:hypothetical protein